MALDQQKYEEEASTRAAERNLTVRDGWMACIGRYNANELVFLDESAANERTSDRKYGWASAAEYLPIFLLNDRNGG